jgi:hypothetical protein
MPLPRFHAANESLCADPNGTTGAALNLSPQSYRAAPGPPIGPWSALFIGSGGSSPGDTATGSRAAVCESTAGGSYPHDCRDHRAHSKTPGGSWPLGLCAKSISGDSPPGQGCNGVVASILSDDGVNRAMSTRRRCGCPRSGPRLPAAGCGAFFSGRIIASLPGSPPGTLRNCRNHITLVGRWVPSCPMRRCEVRAAPVARNSAAVRDGAAREASEIRCPLSATRVSLVGPVLAPSALARALTKRRNSARPGWSKPRSLGRLRGEFRGPLADQTVPKSGRESQKSKAEMAELADALAYANRVRLEFGQFLGYGQRTHER